jgi:hypothetical protein
MRVTASSCSPCTPRRRSRQGDSGHSSLPCTAPRSAYKRSTWRTCHRSSILFLVAPAPPLARHLHRSGIHTDLWLQRVHDRARCRLGGLARQRAMKTEEPGAEGDSSAGRREPRMEGRRRGHLRPEEQCHAQEHQEFEVVDAWRSAVRSSSAGTRPMMTLPVASPYTACGHSRHADRPARHASSTHSA